jgi:transketolase
VDGHSIPEVLAALKACGESPGRPHIIIAHTTKGKGVSIFENQVKFHGVTPTTDEYHQAVKELQSR